MEKHGDFIESFKCAGDAFFANHPSLKHSWRNNPKKGNLTLSIIRESETGFDVGVCCEAYGLYPLAGDWHGSPWDAKTEKHSENSQISHCLGWVRRSLCPATRLRIQTSNGSPFRWNLEHHESGQWILEEEMGLLVFNYFGTRGEVILQNHHLPPSEQSNLNQERYDA
jgi:hypothetical protein